MKAPIVTYEAFGAIGDGVADDLPAICNAHAHANQHGLSVRTKPDATYHLGSRALTAIIATTTDWSTSRFTLDDTCVENHRAPLFDVRSLLEPEVLRIQWLTRDQKRVEARLRRDCFVLVENDNKRLYIRQGLNQNTGVPQSDAFILRRDGSVEGDIDWDYDIVTKVKACPMDTERLFLRGGIFTTFANRMKQEKGHSYWARNIVIHRSNTEIEGLTHYVVGQTSVGQPYSGFISIAQCADVTVRNCFVSGHKTYATIGSAGLPVSMGSYDLHANHVVNFRMIGCRMHHICDRTLWGVVCSNFCKNILLEDCTLSRMDTHMGVSGTYTIRRCRLGYMGIKAIGRGLLTVEDSELYGHALIRFRSDYGSTWEGDVVIRRCRWLPACGDTTWPHMISIRNDGTHNFGYPCSMPRKVTVEDLFVDDRNHPADYSGMYLFADPDQDPRSREDAPSVADKPFPYAPCQTIKIKGLTPASGKKPRLSPNDELNRRIAMIMEKAS